VFTWTVIHNAPPAFKADLPYIVAEIEMDEGPHIEAPLLGVDRHKVHINLAVEAIFCHPAEGDSYPVFVVVERVI
jgi:uncharacterized OB-fold protein